MSKIKCDEVVGELASKNKMHPLDIKTEACDKCKNLGKTFGLCNMNKCKAIAQDDARIMERIANEKEGK